MKSSATICSLLLVVCLVGHSLAETPKLPVYIGRGYNLLQGNPLSDTGVDPGFNHEIIQFTYNTGETTEDNRYLLPDNISHRKTTSCSFSTAISQFTGTESYQSDLKTKATIGGGYNGALLKASFTASTSF